LIRHAEERELRLEIGVLCDATRAELSVGQVGGAGGEDIIGRDATVGVSGRAAAVIVEDVGEQGQRSRARRVRGVAVFLQ
jgi:hypothetical protein